MPIFMLLLHFLEILQGAQIGLNQLTVFTFFKRKIMAFAMGSEFSSITNRIAYLSQVMQKCCPNPVLFM